MKWSRIGLGRSCRAGLLAALCALSVGCASLPPSDLDLRRAAIVMEPAEPAASTDGHSGKLAAAGSGAAKGGGTGALVGTVACLGTGFLFPLCIGAVVPTAAVIGAVTWGTASAVTSDSADVVASKREMLTAALAATPAAARLTTHLQTAARDRFAVELPVAAAGAAPGDWQIEIALTGVSCEDSKPDQPFALRVEARVRLRRAGQPSADYEKRLSRRSDAAWTTPQWRADDDAAAKTELDRTLLRLADDVLTDVTQTPRRT